MAKSAKINVKKNSSENFVKVLATNRSARHNYEILEEFECGIALVGSEVKSLRTGGKLNLADSYCRVIDGEAYLIGAHIAPYEHAIGFGRSEPDRRRKLLLHLKEIAKIKDEVERLHLTVVPLRVYFKGGLVKVEIALAKGKKTYDKRQAITKRDQMREAARDFKNVSR